VTSWQSSTIPSPTTYTWTAAGGAQVTATLNFAPYTVRTNFQCGNYPEAQSTAYLPSSLVLPNGVQYTFGYEQTPGFPADNTTARLASITLPTGGVISYDFSGAPNDDMDCSQVSPWNTVETHTPSLKRTTPDGQWTYANTFIAGGSGQPSQYKTDVFDPQGNKTTHYFTQHFVYRQGGRAIGRSLKQTNTLTYSGTSTLLRTVNICYNGNPSPCSSASSTWDVADPITQLVTQTVLPSSQVSQTVELRDPAGFLTQELDEYDFGSGSPGPLLRKTLTTYGSFNGTGCTALGNHLTAFPCTVTVQDGSGATIAQTRYTYDEGTPVAPPSGTSAQHVSVTGSRGNPTTITTLVGGTTYLTKKFTYYDTGLVQTATDVNGAVTTYNYPDATSTCGNAFATNVSLPLGMSTSTAWDCNGSVITSATDANGQTTKYAYGSDPFWRVVSVTDPLKNAATNTYSAGGTIPPTVESVLSINSTSSIDALTTFDGRGRPFLKQKKQAPGSTNFDTVATGYDAVGRVSTFGLPCVSTASASCSSNGITTTYDALNRKVKVADGGGGSTTYNYAPAGTFNNDVLVTLGPAPSGEKSTGKQRQLEYDGLGRLTSVCELTGTANGGGNCAQNAPQTGYWTKYTYDTTTLNSAQATRYTVTQNVQSSAPQTRTYLHDLLGRLVQETNPESGTTMYTYDSDSACGSSSGDLVKKVDAVGNVTCYAYDSLHRKTGVTYPSGPYASVTPAKTFVYDSTTVSCTANPAYPTGAYVKGRLAEAYTGPSNAKITDLAYCYSPRGETTDVFETTPNSTGTYHTTSTYGASGALSTLTGVPGLNGWTFTPDGEGRPFSVTYGASTNWVGKTSYYPSNGSNPPNTTVTFGNGDTDVYGLDANTGRMNSFQFNVGSTPTILKGTPGWNENGTLGTLAITDQFNSSNTQNCSYVYDDLARVKSVNCTNGSSNVFNQTFTFDPFGNLSKSGSSSFAATYVLSNGTTNNQEQAVGSCVPTYDANGDMTRDCSFSSPPNYAWDSDGNAITVRNGTNLTYDALDREVEFTTGSTHVQILYSPIGKLGKMNGQSASAIRVPLPGGSTAALYGPTGGSVDILHADWLGSSRLATGYGNRARDYDTAYAPYGENYASAGSATANLDFTGQFQDTMSGLYDFLYRQYDPVQGRWIKPDPAGFGAVNTANPQSWNRYGYVANSPLSHTDRLGLCDGEPTSRWCNADYIVDGVETSASFARGLLSSGAATVCNQCQPGDRVGNDNKIYRREWIEPYSYWANWDPFATGIYGTLVPVRGHYGDVTVGSVGGTEDTYPGLALFTNNQALWRHAAGTMNKLTAAYAIGFGALAGGAALSSLESVDIAIGAGEPFHVAFGVDGTWLHATGDLFDMEITGDQAAAWVRGFSSFQFSVPVLNSQAVLATAGTAASTCVTGACYAVLQGWIH